MSQTTKFTKLSIKQKNKEGCLTGANVSIELDGVPVKMLTFFKLELKPGRLAKVTMEMVTSLDDVDVVIGEFERRMPKKKIDSKVK